MVKHVVLFKFFEEKKTNEEEIFVEKLGRLPDEIDLIRSFEIGKNFIDGPKNYDIILISTFDTPDDLKAYSVCEAHKKFLNYMNSCIEDVRVIDFLY